MRLHPVIPMVVRHLMEPVTIGGRDLPAGTNVGPSILISHAREDNYPDPEAFRPERFLQGEVATNTWIPFGGGVRRCIGAGFSLMEGVAVLREVLLRYDVTLPPGRREHPKVRNITSVPRHGARVVVHPAPLEHSSKKIWARLGPLVSREGTHRAGHHLRASRPPAHRARHRRDRAAGRARHPAGRRVATLPRLGRVC